jgi:uncharacterized protein YaaN involved in tellurite resistance
MTAKPEPTVNVDFAALLDGADPSAAPATPLEAAVEAAVDDSGATAPGQFQFRSLLTEDQKASLKAGAPALAAKMTTDLNTVVTFGGPVMRKLNDASTQLLDAQRDITIPEADQLVNDVLRAMDGFEKKYRNVRIEELAKKARRRFKGVTYTYTTMVRESKPITDKLDLAEVKVQEMENRLGDNVTRGQLLHQQSLEHLHSVVGVLAALEEVIDIVRADVADASHTLSAAQSARAGSVIWKGETISTDAMSEIHAKLATALSEIEKTWHDWRQQFFMGFANAPSTRNLVMTQFSLRRRLATFRTMGIPQARQSLALWQQAALAREGAQLGDAVQAGVNKMIQQSFGATADAVAHVANAAQAPIITDETVWSVVDSVREQCRAIVAADTAGRALRERNLKALEAGEVTIRDEFTAAQNQLARNALGGTAEQPGATTAGSVENDVIEGLG